MAVPEILQADRKTAIRILGAADAYAHMLINVRTRIANIMAIEIPEHHTRRLAQRDQMLRPLMSLRDMYETQHRECKEAYRRRMAGERF